MSDAALETRHLAVSFGGVRATRDVSLSVAPKELVAIIGPNGAGKSTLLNLITGVIKPDSGQVLTAGQDITGWKPHHIVRAGIGRKFQVPSTFDDLSVRENIEVSLNGPGAARGGGMSVDAVLERVGLTAKADTLACNLSHGHRQWLEIGMVLAIRPRVLLLDEPTAGMTPEETARTAEIAREVAQVCSVVAIEHDMSFVRALDCRTVVLHQGALLRDSDFQTISEDEEVRDIYLGRHT
ncbi:MAG: ATP-binding cassette domain-containing protein [Roseovarius sp.]|uniref:ATP-binding cassette domain-containing protein n=1 Tax=Roseovarius sp. TaxID=1486281 RepID=UPI0032EB8331